MRRSMMLVAVLAVLALVAGPVIAQVSLGIGDTENESGEIATENSFAIEGDNNNACLGQLQFGNTGNFTNQQGALQYAVPPPQAQGGGPPPKDPIHGPEVEFAPENATGCEQAVQQSAAASSL